MTKTVAAGNLTLLEPGQDHTIVTVEIETDQLLEQRAARIAKATGLSQNIVLNQALVTGLLLELLKRAQ